MGLLTPCSVPTRGFLYTMIVPGGGGRGFALFKSCPGGMVMDEIDTCIKGTLGLQLSHTAHF